MKSVIEFMDCPFCGKSIRINASRCHRCGRALMEHDPEDTDAGFPEYAEGGYDSDEEEHDSADREDSPSRLTGKVWFLVAWLMIAVILLPIVLNAIDLLVR